MQQSLDKLALSKAMKTKRVIELSLGVRDVAKKVKISPATIARIENQRTIDLESFIKACNWLNVSVCEFIKPKTKYITNKK